MNIRFYVSRIFRLPNKLSHELWKVWNRFKFHISGVRFGRELKVFNSVYVNVNRNASIIIGNNFTLTSGNCINPLCRNLKGCLVANPNASIIIGDNVGMSSTCVWAHQQIKIGNNVNIGGDVIIMDSDAHSLNYLDRRSDLDLKNKIDKNIEIEDDVLIGARCVILKGVCIGARSVIGSGSVVTRDIPADCIAAGNPCKTIRFF